MFDIKTLQKNIRRRNILITSLVLTLFCISSLSLNTVFKQQEQGAEIVKLVGNQKMLSQKIAYFSYVHLNNLSKGESGQNIRTSLFEVANLFSENQKLLTKLVTNEQGLIPEDVFFLYSNSLEPLNNKINIYVDSAIELSQTHDVNRAKKLIEINFDKDSIEQLLVTLDLVVVNIEQHVNKRIPDAEMNKYILWFATIVLLITMIIWFFIPLQRAIKKNYRDMSKALKQSKELNLVINKHAITFRITVGETTSITEVNDRFLEFYCYEKEEVLGLSFPDVCGERYNLEYLNNIIKECDDNE